MNPPLQLESLQDWSPTTLLLGDINIRRQANDISRPSVPSKTAHIPISSLVATLQSQNSSLSQSPQPAEAEAIAWAFAAPMPMGTSSTGVNGRLTEEQSGLVQSMMRHNVPLSSGCGYDRGHVEGEGTAR